jgi:hypothetical protein
MPAPLRDERRVDVAEWIGRDRYLSADRRTQEAYLRFCLPLVLDAKRRQIESNVGADGRELLRVRPTSRPDGSRDDPLHPHGERSRTLRLIRGTPVVRLGVITLDWHRFTTVVGYHAVGAGSLPTRDIIGTPDRFFRGPKGQARREWERLTREAERRAERRRNQRIVANINRAVFGARRERRP